MTNQFSPSTQANQSEGEYILVVDDAMPLRKLVGMVLSKAGYKTSEVESAELALEKLGAEGPRIKLLITDLSMPNMDGFELIRQARQLLPQLKVLVMTGSYTFEEIQAPLLALGIGNLLVKPFTHPQLINAVANALREAEPLAEV